MSFLAIPSEEGLFTAIKTRKSAEDEVNDHRDDDNDEDNDDDDDEDYTGDVRLIPRCSPVPRKRGSSIYDETAEYLRIHQALHGGKRVSFADTTGGDLVDVKEFTAYHSDEDEEGRARWEEEEAKYRKPEKEPTYHLRPEFEAPAAAELLRAVRANKVEVEQVSEVEEEPLAFSGLVQVLNVSFHKAVYIRSTMDSWASYYDHPAEYVPGSHDGDTDRFSFKLSFAPPYVTHGSRIEFVVRYETSDGDYWANNSSVNYVVTLLLSYDEDSDPRTFSAQQLRGILRAPRAHSMNDEFDSEDEQENEEEEGATSRSGLVRPTAVCPVIVRPDIDVEAAARPSGCSAPPDHQLPSADAPPSAPIVSPGERPPCTSSETTVQTNSSFVPDASESLQLDSSEPLPTIPCESDSQTSVPASASSPQQPSGSTPDGSEAGGEETPPSESSCVRLSAAGTDQCSTPGEDVPADVPNGPPSAELPAESFSAPDAVERPEVEAAAGLTELDAGLPEDSATPAEHHDGGTEIRGAEGEAPPSAGLTEDSSSPAVVGEVSRDAAPQTEKEDARHISPHASLEDLPNTPSEVSDLRSESDIIRLLKPAIIFLGVAISIRIALHDPRTLLLIVLLSVLNRY